MRSMIVRGPAWCCIMQNIDFQFVLTAGMNWIVWFAHIADLWCKNTRPTHSLITNNSLCLDKHTNAVMMQLSGLVTVAALSIISLQHHHSPELHYTTITTRNGIAWCNIYCYYKQVISLQPQKNKRVRNWCLILKLYPLLFLYRLKLYLPWLDGLQ